MHLLKEAVPVAPFLEQQVHLDCQDRNLRKGANQAGKIHLPFFHVNPVCFCDGHVAELFQLSSNVSLTRLFFIYTVCILLGNGMIALSDD